MELYRGEEIMKLTIEEAQNMMERNFGYLDLSDTPIQTLPDSLTVGGWLDLRGTPIQTLPDNLTKSLPTSPKISGRWYRW